MSICNHQHRYNPIFESLPQDQSYLNIEGRHKCAGCAYELGYQQGLNRVQSININFSSLPDSQAGTVRHKSTYLAFAQGYNDGILASYN